MPTHHQIKIALIIGLLLAIAGCARPVTVRMYEGPELPPEEKAIIKESRHEHDSSTTEAYILKLDGEWLPNYRTTPGVVEVLPGDREITCWVTYASFWTAFGPIAGPPLSLTFQAEAGHVYRVDGDFHYVKSHLWIVDETTGVEVAAHRPEIPRPESIEHKPF